MTTQLRWYQQEAVDSVYKFFRENAGSPAIVIPTGGGKTKIMAKIASDFARYGKRVCLLASRVELIEQTANDLRSSDDTLDVGVFSASLRTKQKQCAITVAQVQSIATKAYEFEPFDLIIVDEAHEIPPEGDGRYRAFLSDCRTANPKIRLIGLTATPYRLGSGMLCGPEKLLTDICFRVGVRELMNEGYLCRVVAKEPQRCDTSKLHVRSGEFIEKEVSELMMGTVGAACEDIVKRTSERKSVLVFCCSQEHAMEVAGRLKALQSDRVECVVSGILGIDRQQIADDFRSGSIKYLVNVNIYTTGFDARNVDCVVMLRPTMSAGLYYQMIGRGFRLNTGKETCLVLDYAGNIEAHGPVDEIVVKEKSKRKSAGDDEEPEERTTRVCKKCFEIFELWRTECPGCGELVAQVRTPNHNDKPSEANPIGSEPETHAVLRVLYSPHRKKNAPDAPVTMRVDYQTGHERFSEWVCLDHDHGSFARKKATEWLNLRIGERMESADPDAISVDEAVDIGNRGYFMEPESIMVVKDGKTGFNRITPIGMRYATDVVEQQSEDSSIGADYEIPF